MKVEFDGRDWSIDEDRIEELIENKVTTVKEKKSINPSKLFIGTILITAFAIVAVYVPNLRFVLGLLALFGTMSFLRWLDK